jgi:hypothetical protein
MAVMPPSTRLVALRERQLTRAGRLAADQAPRSPTPPASAAAQYCPKCGTTLNLARVERVPSGYDIRTFDCTGCDYAHIVTVAAGSPGETRSPAHLAADALEEAQNMPPGPRRSEALKKAGRLRSAADKASPIATRDGLPK